MTPNCTAEYRENKTLLLILNILKKSKVSCRDSASHYIIMSPPTPTFDPPKNKTIVIKPSASGLFPRCLCFPVCISSVTFPPCYYTPLISLFTPRKAAIHRKGKYSIFVPVMTVCGLAAGAGAHHLPDDARCRVPGMGRD